MGRLNQYVLSATTSSVSGINSDETIEKNIDLLQGLREENWKKLSVKDKLNILQTVANIEAHYLGLNHEVNIETVTLSPNTLGKYCIYTYQIIISLDEIENCSPMDSVKTVAHECYHAYQHELVDLLNETENTHRTLSIFKEAKKYKAEFENYKDADDDFDEYYNQQCEQDAREYAVGAVYEYENRIYNYIDTNTALSMIKS